MNMKTALFATLLGCGLVACGGDKQKLVGFGCPLISPLATVDEWRDQRNPAEPAFIVTMHELEVECLFDEGETPTRNITVIASARILKPAQVEGQTFQIPAFVARLRNGDQLESNFEANLPVKFPPNLRIEQIIPLSRYVIRLDFEAGETENAKKNEIVAGFIQTKAQLSENRKARYDRLVKR